MRGPLIVDALLDTNQEEQLGTKKAENNLKSINVWMDDIALYTSCRILLRHNGSRRLRPTQSIAA